MKARLLISLKIMLAILVTGILFYNFYVAYYHKYKSGGDALSFIALGVSLAEFQKYGEIKASDGSIMKAFENKNISREEISFAGHSTWRPPFWPFLIAVIFLVFGYNLTYILIFKFLLHLTGIFIFYKTLKLLKLKKVLVLIGCFLYAIHPAWQIYSRVFLSEPITMFLLTLWVYLLISFLQKKMGFLPQAIVGGVLILSHPYYLFLPFSVWLALLINKQLNFKKLFLTTIICASIISVWVIRNYIVLDADQFVLTTSSGAVMAKGWNRDVPNLHTNTKGDLANETLVLNNYEYNRDKVYNEVERMELYKNATIHFIKSNPDLIFPIISQKLLSAFNPFPETEKPGMLETGRWLFQFFALLALLYILIFTKNKLIYSLAIGLILSTIGITILTYSGFRFRMPQVGLELLFIIFIINDMIKKMTGFTSSQSLK